MDPAGDFSPDPVIGSRSTLAMSPLALPLPAGKIAMGVPKLRETRGQRILTTGRIACRAVIVY